MNIKNMIISSFLSTALLAQTSLSQPNEEYKSGLDLLKKERKSLRNETIWHSSIPFPLPIISNLLHGIPSYGEYKKIGRAHV